MKFEDALTAALDKMPKIDGKENVVSPQTAKILAIMWDMLIESKIVLDNFVFINENNQIKTVDEKKSQGRKIKHAEETGEPEADE